MLVCRNTKESDVWVRVRSRSLDTLLYVNQWLQFSRRRRYAGQTSSRITSSGYDGELGALVDGIHLGDEKMLLLQV